jgi:microcin C transport system substrate-binding protein
MVKFFPCCLFIACLQFCGNAFAAHAFSLYDSPKYGPGFTHFDYVNPNAPKGGELFLANPDRRTSFDKFNPFSMKGVDAPGVSAFMFETLTTGAADEVASMYGLLADDMVVAPDRMSIVFRLNAKARFNNGDPVLATDVKHSFDTLVAKGSPQVKSLFSDVKSCTVLNDRTVRFDFKVDNRELPLIVGGMPVFSRKWAAGIPFDKIQLEQPIVSGPYLIERYDISRGITFKLDPNYWGKDLPVRRGSYNFGRISYRFYKDDVARLEGFKSGEFDAVIEYSAKNWARRYNGPKFRSGEIIKRELKHSNSEGMQGLILNLRRPQFQDVRVRQALGLAFDFEWMRRNLFYGQYTRIASYFNNSELGAKGVPSEDELKILTPLKSKLDPVVFGPAPVPPSTDPPSSLRDNLRKARALLEQAGWTYRDGALRNAKGEPFVFEIMEDPGPGGRIIAVYVRALQKLGIQVRERVADFALLQKRIEERDFDTTIIRFPAVESPGKEFVDVFGSEAADQKGSNNYWGLKDPAIDRILAAMIAAKTRKELVAATNALDRVLLHKHIVVPQWYSTVHRVAYRDRFGMPDKTPPYYHAEPYISSTWWQVKPR